MNRDISEIEEESESVGRIYTGDLQQAIDKLASIEAAKPAPLQQWLDRANGRLAQQSALQSVSNAVLRVIAASQSPDQSSGQSSSQAQ